MESAVNVPLRFIWGFFLILLLGFTCPALGAGEEVSPDPTEGTKGQLKLRKTVKSRDYQGKSIQGEERVVGPGDSLWRMLIQEKGLPEKSFNRYVLLIGSLNPHLKKVDVLRVGDTIFIPTRPDEILGIQVAPGKSEAKLYRVKRGDHLFKILREQFGVKGEPQVLGAFEQVKELNPRKKNWDVLIVGETIAFPGRFGASTVTAATEKASEKVSVETEKAAVEIPKSIAPPVTAVIGLDYGQKLPVKESLEILSEVVGVLGNETQRGGEETLALQEGTIRLDRASYPTIHNSKLGRKVVLDMEGKMPSSVRTRLEAQSAGVSVIPVRKGGSVHDVANSLLSQLGFQTLPTNRPIVVQDGGVGVHVKGEWIVTTPEDSGGKQEMWIISLTDALGQTPDYLTDYLGRKGMNLKDIVLPISSDPGSFRPTRSRVPAATNQIEKWPADKTVMVDSLLRSYQIPFSMEREVSVTLREGIRMDTKVDRLFEFGGKKVALLFRPIGNEIKRSLEEKEGVRVIEVDLVALSSRNLIARLLESFGERVAYREHRFPALDGTGRDKIVMAVSGFYIPQRSLLLTDREIPKELAVFFGEKGLQLVYFQ